MAVPQSLLQPTQSLVEPNFSLRVDPVDTCRLHAHVLHATTEQQVAACLMLGRGRAEGVYDGNVHLSSYPRTEGNVILRTAKVDVG